MMRQQINLYLDGFEVSKVEMSANKMGLIVGAFVLAFVAVSIFAEMRADALKTKSSRLAATKNVKTQEVEALTAELEALKASPVLERRAESLQRSVRAKQKLIVLLGESTGGNTKGFASYLRGLAKHPVSGIWLTQISLTNGGQDIGFAGITTKPENLPGFLQQIGQETPFAGRQFEKLEMESADGSDEGEKLQFLIRTRLEESRR